MPLNAVRAASIVASISAGPWAIDTNHASNCDGGSRMPRSSIAPKNRAYASRSDASASAASAGGVGAEEDRQQRSDPGDGDLAPRAAAASVSPAASAAADSSRAA